MTTYVEGLALDWAREDPLESWMLAVDDAQPITPAALRDIVSDYLADHEPFPDGTRVMTTGYDGQEVSAVIIGRPCTDEWTVLFDDGAEAWRDQSQLRISDRI